MLIPQMLNLNMFKYDIEHVIEIFKSDMWCHVVHIECHNDFLTALIQNIRLTWVATLYI